MLTIQLKSAFRNLFKEKNAAIINLLGLGLGLLCALLISVYVTDELSYDNFIPNAGRIYRVNGDLNFGGREVRVAVAPDPMAAQLVKDYPQIEAAVRFRNYGSFIVSKGEQSIKEERVIYADSTLFDVFELPVLLGNPAKALAAPNSVVITEKIAKKYFNKTDVLGETLLFDDKNNLKITAVIKDLPRNTHMQFDIFVCMANSEESRQNNWVSNNFQTYIRLKEGAEIGPLSSSIDQWMEANVAPLVNKLLNISMDQFKAAGNYLRYTFIPLRDIHLHSNRVAEFGPNGSILYVYIFLGIAFFVLLNACINYMNMASAQASTRAREIGIRKVLGSQQAELIRHFLAESLLMTFLAVVIAFIGSLLLLAWFNQLSGKDIHWSALFQPKILIGALILAGISGILAGSYPAFFLASFRPVKALKGELDFSGKRNYLRSGLIIIQFLSSIILIIGTITIYRQLNFIQNKSLGFDRENVLVIDDAYALGVNMRAFKQEILKENGVLSVTTTGYLPVSSYRSDNPYFPSPTLDPERGVSTQSWAVDHDYIQTMGMEITQGRNFSRNYLSDSSAVIINETSARMFGIAELNQDKLYTLENMNSNEVLEVKVIGIVKDFHFESLRENITPVLFYLGKDRDLGGAVSLRFQTQNTNKLIDQIQAQWKKLAPGQPFNYRFMDEAFDEMYRAERKIGNVFITFAILAILIACLGLFGLVAFVTQRRTKEIGIRKVLGASTSSVVTMISKDFIGPVLIAVIVSIPPAWYGMSKWLENFAYRIHLEWWIFALAGVIAMFIALVTISLQSIRAAWMHPIDSLRSE